MRIGREFVLSILEIVAFTTALIGVILGAFGNRITWPWWITGSLLYSYLFFQSEYFASAALQFIFIAGGVWGWIGWGPQGAKPKRCSVRERSVLIVTLSLSSIALWPILVGVGASSTVIESFGFVGSVMAQLLMIWQRFEAWPLWVAVNIAYTYQYFVGELYLTSILYAIFLLVAIFGWIRWQRESKNFQIN